MDGKQIKYKEIYSLNSWNKTKNKYIETKRGEAGKDYLLGWRGEGRQIQVYGDLSAIEEAVETGDGTDIMATLSLLKQQQQKTDMSLCLWGVFYPLQF